MEDLAQQEIKTIEVIEDYVDEYFENEVLKLIPNRLANGKGRNQILRYGHNRPYNDNIISSTIPDIFDRFKDTFVYDSITINEYYPNQTINWHVDHPLDLKEIIIISLLSPAEIKFRKREGDKLITKVFYLPRYSLCKFSDELRYDWEHSLTASQKRYSIVFRNSKDLKNDL
jgi:hypothetical protein